MAEIPPPMPPAPVIPGAQDPSVTALATSVRRLKIWLAVLSAFVGLLILAACSILGLYGMTFSSFMSEDMTIPEDTIANTRETIEKAYGDKLEDLEVRAVDVEYGDVPFPVSVMEGSMNEQAVYVEYRLEGTDVVFADVASGMWGEDPAASGMLPLNGSLASRMDQEQLDAFLKAYSAQSKKPLGSVLRYDDPSMTFSGEPVKDTVTVGKTDYQSRELWRATEGVIVEGDTFDVNAGSGMSRTALVFHEDPKTGEFVFLGTEPAETMW